MVDDPVEHEPNPPQPTARRGPVPGATAPSLGLTPRPPLGPRAPFIGGAVAPVSPAAWHADPRGRHQYRWWDGIRWTHHVGDDGVASIDQEGI